MASAELDPEVNSAERGKAPSPVFQVDRYMDAYDFEGRTPKLRATWDRLRGRGRRVPGFRRSLRNVISSSWINVFFVVLPFAWASHFMNDVGRWPHELTFALCFVSIIPLDQMLDWGGEQMALYLGSELGDLVNLTLNNAVEAALAIALLCKCELRLLQATIIGVVVLHALLIPGTAFLFGGATIFEQSLNPRRTKLNHSLLVIGVLTVLLPTTLFASLDRGAQAIAPNDTATYAGDVVSDHMRGEILKMSRGLALMLLAVYVASRIFIFYTAPIADADGRYPTSMALEAKREENELRCVEAEVHPLACVALLGVTVTLMCVTAEFLVESIDDLRGQRDIREEWFGLILLPIVSFSSDGCIAIAYFARLVLNRLRRKETMVPSELAKGGAIDLSIQFTLFWLPFFVLLGWCIGKPISMLFDFYEVGVVLSACFVVNYVTADSKTDWVEGLIMIAFYIMIGVTAWFYIGQPELSIMLSCPESITAALAGGPDASG